MFMDAFYCRVREERRYVTKAAYVVLDVTMNGRKDILEVWIGAHGNSKFWLNMLNNLKSSVCFGCISVLHKWPVLDDAGYRGVFPKGRLQRCIVRQVRSSTRYVRYKEIKKVIADLKKIYSFVTLEETKKHLQSFVETWRKQRPSCVKSWEEN